MTNTRQRDIIEVGIDKSVTIKSKNHGLIKIHTLIPCENYSLAELLLLSKNNPNHFIYNHEKQCFYTHDFGLAHLEHGSSPRFYTLFLGAMYRDDRKFATGYYDACKKYLKRYSEMQIESDHE